MGPSGLLTGGGWPRLESEEIIEEFMILANICAAEFLQEQRLPCPFRIHEAPVEKKVCG